VEVSAVFQYLQDLLSANGYAPHGYCLLWQPELIWTHVISDAVIAISYFSIPVALIWFVRRRGDIAFSWVFWCFALFILACGTTHIMSIWTLWQPDYGVEALIKVVTAIVSVLTALALWPLLPKALAIPSPAQLTLANEELALRIVERDEAIGQLQAEITERKRTEALLEEKSRELYVAKTAAESASQAKSGFLANMSHELRTPLNAILGYAQLLTRDRSLGERQGGAARTIHQSGAHLLTLITDILDLSRIEAGKFELVPAALDLRAFMNGIADIIRVRTEEKALEFVCDVPPDLPDFVLADEKRLRQVLLNLLGNAVKFTDRGEVRLHVTVVSLGEADVRLGFEVRDTGVGIAQDQLETIFQPFEQVGEMQRRTGGTGLGLSISRQLIGLMKSTMKVASKPGEGSCFSFELDLPVVRVEPALESKDVDFTGYLGPRRTVLIVDDMLASRMVLADTLGELGFETRQAVNGLDGLEQAEAAPPDLILMDIRMPVMDGLEAMQQIREVEALRSVPIIAVSAAVTTEDRARSLAAGANAFLPKPVEHEELIRLIGRHLKLDWTGETRNSMASGPADPLVAPPQAEIEVLHGLAMAGDMRGIRAQADRLAALDARYRSFADKLQQLAKSYQSQAILNLIEQHLDMKQGTES
jgi:signal transduction histidine kinase/DNA-binding NarL/FixJ family response regulator